jgi:hypothetical protein
VRGLRAAVLSPLRPQIHSHAGTAIGRLVHCEYFHTHARAERLLFDGVIAPRRRSACLTCWRIRAAGRRARGVVVGPGGDFAWMCFPRWHCGACLAQLIVGRGVCAVTPTLRCVWGGSTSTD